MSKTPKTTSKPVWSCPHGCDLSRQACRHLDKLVDDPRGGLGRSIGLAIENMGVKDPGEPGAGEERFDVLLSALVLSEDEKELLRERFVGDASFETMAERMGFTSKGAVRYISSLTLAKVRKQLVKRGYK